MVAYSDIVSNLATVKANASCPSSVKRRSSLTDNPSGNGSRQPPKIRRVRDSASPVRITIQGAIQASFVPPDFSCFPAYTRFSGQLRARLHNRTFPPEGENMSHDDDEDYRGTLMLKAPLIAGIKHEKRESLSSTAKLVCLDSQYLESPPASNEYWLTRSEEVVGRGTECTVYVNSADLSRVHARIRAFSNRWMIEDCGSRNGVWVNDARLESRATISSGDTIRLGRVPFRFEVLDIAPSELPPGVVPNGESSATREQSNLEETLPLNLSETERRSLAGETNHEPNEDKVASAVKKTLARASVLGVRVDDTSESELGEAVVLLRKALPQIIKTLVASARAGDAEASRACLDYLMQEEQRLPENVKLQGTIEERVKQTVSAMAERKITPRQALDILQSFTSARDLLKKHGA